MTAFFVPVDRIMSMMSDLFALRFLSIVTPHPLGGPCLPFVKLEITSFFLW